jgi:hypothetical protein
MRSLTLAALTAAALTAAVAHADVTDDLFLTYQSGATFNGTVVLSNDFSTILSFNGILNGYDASITGFQGAGFSDLISDGGVPPFNLNLSPNTFVCQLFDGPFGNNWLEFGYSYDSSGFTLLPGGAEPNPQLGLLGYNNVNFTDAMVSAAVPEPGTPALLALGLLGLAAGRRRWAVCPTKG